MPKYDLTVNSLKEALLQNISEQYKSEMTILPARVISTKDYEKLQCLSVEILISEVYTRKNEENAQTIKLEKVQVRLPRFGKWQFRYPVDEGDLVLVHWARKDLSLYLDGTGDVVVQSFDEVGGLEDCFITLDGATRKTNNKPDLKNLEIEGANTKFTVTPEGDITTVTNGNIKCTAKGTYDIEAEHLTVHNDTTIKGELVVEKSTTLEDTLEIKGVTTAKSALNAEAGVFASSYSGLSGSPMTVSVDMGVSGTVTINGVNINTHTHNESGGGVTEGMN